jgi:hypothetical protein
MLSSAPMVLAASPASAAAWDQLVVNNDFNDGLDGWTVDGDVQTSPALWDYGATLIAHGSISQVLPSVPAGFQWEVFYEAVGDCSSTPGVIDFGGEGAWSYLEMPADGVPGWMAGTQGAAEHVEISYDAPEGCVGLRVAYVGVYEMPVPVYDGDGTSDGTDNCSEAFNPDQAERYG